MLPLQLALFDPKKGCATMEDVRRAFADVSNEPDAPPVERMPADVKDALFRATAGLANELIENALEAGDEPARQREFLEFAYGTSFVGDLVSSGGFERAADDLYDGALASGYAALARAAAASKSRRGGDEGSSA